MTNQEHRWVLVGGLASGKSAVRELLAARGVATIDADRVGHEVIEPDGPAYSKVAKRWPDVVDGRIDRRALAEIVFESPAELAALEEFTHPYIFDRIRARVEQLERTVVVEMPLLARHLADWRRIVVDARDEERIGRAVGRGMDEDDARARLLAQPSRQEWLAAAHLVIPNHGSMAELERCVAQVVDLL